MTTDPEEPAPETAGETAVQPVGQPDPDSGLRGWRRRAQLPLPTVLVFLILDTILWTNAAVNRYRFNVVIALLGSVPLLVLIARGALHARGALKTGDAVPAQLAGPAKSVSSLTSPSDEEPT